MNKESLSYLTLKLTNRCNLKCAMCGQVQSGDRFSLDEISMEIIGKIVNEANSVKHIYLFGGEPLLYSKIEKLLEELRIKKILSHITTNGTLLEKYAAKIVSCDISSVEISLDSHDKNTLYKIRGRDVYEEIKRGIHKLAEEKERQKKSTPSISINFVILPCNFKEIKAFVEHIRKFFPEVEYIYFQYPMVTNVLQGLCQDKINQEEFGIPCESWKWFNNTFQKFSDDEMRFIFKELKELEMYPNVKFKKVRSEKEFKGKFRGEINNLKSICECPFNSLTILPNGDAVFCPDFPDVKLGNIYKMDLQEIWNSNNSQIFRSHLLEKGNYPICKSCYHIDEKLCEEN